LLRIRPSNDFVGNYGVQHLGKLFGLIHSAHIKQFAPSLFTQKVFVFKADIFFGGLALFICSRLVGQVEFLPVSLPKFLVVIFIFPGRVDVALAFTRVCLYLKKRLQNLGSKLDVGFLYEGRRMFLVVYKTELLKSALPVLEQSVFYAFEVETFLVNMFVVGHPSGCFIKGLVVHHIQFRFIMAPLQFYLDYLIFVTRISLCQ
jgi:hypothetical protein